ncbi:MAG: hypothetical protein M3Z36_09210 [Acidobacteriota bacterium]|nr:hypothetical protein [Acidobacteriota bacterium]
MPRNNNRQRLRDYLSTRKWTSVGKEEWQQLRREFPGIAENSLREMLQESTIEIAQPYCGVRQKSLEDLESSLLGLYGVYAGHPDQAGTCRKLVIQAKDRARFVTRNAKVIEPVRAMKEEMVRWMLVWLDDPSMFESWVRARKTQIA